MKRKFQVKDLFRLEQIGRYFGGPFSFSPDGKTLAYVRQRAKETTKHHKQDFLWGNDRADIWLVDLPKGKPVNLTQGEKEDVGYWSPAWSPDGQRLAMLSTKGDNVTLWVWSKATGDWRQLTQRGITFDSVPLRPYCWISAEKIICSVLPEGEKPKGMMIEMNAPQKAMQAWQKAWRGEKTTVSILQSGVPVDLSNRYREQLVLINVTDGSTQTLLTGNTQEYTLSPDKQWLGLLETVDIRQPQAHLSLDFELKQRFAVKLISLENNEQKTLEISKDVLLHSLRWSGDGTKLAFIGYSQERNEPPRVYSWNLLEGKIQTWGSSILNPAPLVRRQPQLLWSADNSLLVYAARTEEKAKPSPQDRFDTLRALGDGDS